MDTSFYRGHFELFQKLSIVRRLPPGTHLLLPAVQESRQLLADLVPLGDDVDPIGWLKEEGPDLTAQLAVYYSLLELRSRIVGARRASWYGFSAKPETPIVADAEEPSDELLRGISRDVLPSRESLMSRLAHLRPAAHGDDREQTSPQMSLLADTLAATHGTGVDPFDWARDEQADLAASVVLSHILNEHRPPLHSVQVGPVLRVERPAARIWPTDYFNLTVDEIVVGRGAFMVHVTTRVDLKRLPTVARPDYHMHFLWHGFKDVVDDAGHRYLPQHTEWNGDRSFWQRGEQMSMAIYPSISPEVHELRFTSRAGNAQISQSEAKFRPTHPDDRPDHVMENVPTFPEFSWTYTFPT